MGWLLALVWALYLSECFTRHQNGTVVFRGRRIGKLKASTTPDLELADGRLSLSWTSLVPWHFGIATRGESRSPRDARQTRVLLLRALRHSEWLRVSAGGLFIGLLVGMPAIVLTDRVSALLWIWAPILGAFWVTTVMLFFGASREVHGRGPALETGLMILLSPLSAIQAPAILLNSVTQDRSALVVATLVCSDAELLKMFRRVYFDTPGARTDLERLLKSRKLASALLTPPTTEPGMLAFCPRCHTLYQEQNATCADCQEIALQPL